MTELQKYLISGVASLLILIGIIFAIQAYGNSRYNEGIAYQQTQDMQSALAAKENAELLQKKLNEANLALVNKQKELQEERDKKATPYVNKYNAKIQEKSVAEAIDSSGLLDVINATSPTGE